MDFLGKMLDTIDRGFERVTGGGGGEALETSGSAVPSIVVPPPMEHER
jgi:hypothetical protein